MKKHPKSIYHEKCPKSVFKTGKKENNKSAEDFYSAHKSKMWHKIISTVKMLSFVKQLIK